MGESIPQSIADLMASVKEALSNESSPLKELLLVRRKLFDERNEYYSQLDDANPDWEDKKGGDVLLQEAKNAINSTLAAIEQRIKSLSDLEVIKRGLEDHGEFEAVTRPSSTGLIIELGKTLYHAGTAAQSRAELISQVQGWIRSARMATPLDIDMEEVVSDDNSVTWFWTGLWGFWWCRKTATKEHPLTAEELVAIQDECDPERLLAWCGQIKWNECYLTRKSIERLKRRLPKRFRRTEPFGEFTIGGISVNAILANTAKTSDYAFGALGYKVKPFLPWILD
ncbi:MAG TPA: hypothetical protein PLY87_11675 [Planctomycetaceae bacterium]|nr:hypothetical protein [Planctomycetaceae bacterium]HQZ65732.1 hypothetical protein [Planctomycetaceae bacterium]